MAADRTNPYQPPETEQASTWAPQTRTGKLAWEEPARFICAWERATKGRANPWRALACMALVASFLFVTSRASWWIRGQEHPQFGSWGLLAVALGIGFAVAYLLPLIRSMAPAMVWIGEAGIGRQSFIRSFSLRQVERWPWEEIASCSLERLDLGGRSFDTLRLRLRDRSDYAIGLSRKLPPSQIEGWVRANATVCENHL